MSNETMNIVITSVVIPFLVALVALFMQYTAVKSAELKTRLHNEEVSKYVDIAEKAVITAVGAVSEVLVDTLKELAENGKLTDEQQTIAFTEARNRALLIMGVAGKDAVKELYGDFDAWMDNTIQYYVRKQKPQVPVITAVTVDTPAVGDIPAIVTTTYLQPVI